MSQLHFTRQWARITRYQLEEAPTTADYDVGGRDTRILVNHGTILVMNILLSCKRPATILGVLSILPIFSGFVFAPWPLFYYFQSREFLAGLAPLTVFFTILAILTRFKGNTLDSLMMSRNKSPIPSEDENSRIALSVPRTDVQNGAIRTALSRSNTASHRTETWVGKNLRPESGQ